MPSFRGRSSLEYVEASSRSPACCPPSGAGCFDIVGLSSVPAAVASVWGCSEVLLLEAVAAMLQATLACCEAVSVGPLLAPSDVPNSSLVAVMMLHAGLAGTSLALSIRRFLASAAALLDAMLNRCVSVSASRLPHFFAIAAALFSLMLARSGSLRGECA